MKRKTLCILCVLLVAVMYALIISNIAITRNDTATKMKEKNSVVQMSNHNAPDLSDWRLKLVNSQNKLPQNFRVHLTELDNGHKVDERIAKDLQDMLEAAAEEDLHLIICSSYRSNEVQQNLYKNKIDQYLAEGYSLQEAEREAGKWVAIPGTSEHQTGLAVDLVALSYQILDENQANTDEQRWLMKNAHQYGFILRYPSDKSRVTGIYYEPWHYRYVGKDAAKEIYEKGICLEEYLGIVMQE